MQGLNSLGNILILAEEDELTEQCGVNTSSTFNTPPNPFYELDPETWKVAAASEEEEEKPEPELNAEIWWCKSPGEPVKIFPTPSKEEALAAIKDMAVKLDQASRPTPEHIRMAVEEVAANLASEEDEPDDGGRHPQGIPHFAEEMVNKRMAEKEPEPREATPVEKLIDAVLRVQAVGLVDMAKDAQEFLDHQVSKKFFSQVAILHELGHILIQRMDDNDVKEVVTEFSDKLTRIVEGKTD